MTIKTNFPLSPTCLARYFRSHFGFASNSPLIATLLKKHRAVVDKKLALSDGWFLIQVIEIQKEQSCLSYKTR